MVVAGSGAGDGPEEVGTKMVPVTVVAIVLVAGVGIKVMVLGTAVQIPGFCGTKAAQTPAK